MKLNQKFIQIFNLISVLTLILSQLACEQKGHPEAKIPRTQFNAQLAQSCLHNDIRYTKTVIDVNSESATPQDSVFSSAQLFGQTSLNEATDSSSCVIQQDLAYALSFYYDQPSLREYFELEQKQDTTIARIKPQYANSSDLQVQKILMQPGKDLFRYVESQIMKKSWLYELEIQIKVQFDEAGRYIHHELEINNLVPFSSSHFHSIIQGKASYL